MFGQANVGEFSCPSIGTSIDVVGPLLRPFAGGLRFTWATTQEDIPAQGQWYLGGTKTVRGYPANSMVGNAAYVVNAEIGTDPPLVRLVGFVDVGAAGSSGKRFDPEPLVSVGPGLSLFEGIVRLDFAWGLTRNGVFRIHFATSGIF